MTSDQTRWCLYRSIQQFSTGPCLVQLLHQKIAVYYAWIIYNSIFLLPLENWDTLKISPTLAFVQECLQCFWCWSKAPLLPEMPFSWSGDVNTCKVYGLNCNSFFILFTLPGAFKFPFCFSSWRRQKQNKSWVILLSVIC